MIVPSLSFTQENETLLLAEESLPVVESETVYFSDYVYTVIDKLPEIQLNKLKNTEASVKLLKALKQKE